MGKKRRHPAFSQSPGQSPAWLSSKGKWPSVCPVIWTPMRYHPEHTIPSMGLRRFVSPVSSTLRFDSQFPQDPIYNESLSHKHWKIYQVTHTLPQPEEIHNRSLRNKVPPNGWENGGMLSSNKLIALRSGVQTLE